MEKDKIITYIEHPEKLNESTLQGLRELIDDFPYFPVARMLYLRNLKNINSYKFERELEKHAVFIPDRSVLYKFLHETNKVTAEPFELLKFEIGSDYMNTQKLSSEAQVAEKEDDSQGNRMIELIDQFLVNHTPMQPTGKAENAHKKSVPEQNQEVDDDLITDTLAKIYMKQGFYEKAIDAYRKLSLKFPEKNSYFATQIEEIEKLMS